MFKKKLFTTLLFLIILASAISAVNAEDLNATGDIISDASNDEIAISEGAIEEIASSDDVGDVIASSEEDILKDSSTGTYTQLEDLIESKYQITLTKDYCYDDDKDFLDVIFVEDDVVINGNGHSIYTGEASSVFCIHEGYVEIYDLKFIYSGENTAVAQSGAAIENYGDLYLENCIFYGFKATDQGGALANFGNMDVNKCYFMNNAVTEANGRGGAIYNDKELYVNGSYFANGSAAYGGAIYNKGNAWIQNSIFGSYENNELDIHLVGPNSASYGTSIYNDNGCCDVLVCSFGDDSAEEGYDGGAVYDVIAYQSIFDDGNTVYGGVLSYCNVNPEDVSNNTILSTGFTFSTATSISTNYASGKQLIVNVTNEPDGVGVKGVRIELVIDGDESNKRYIYTDSMGIAKYSVSYLTPGKHTIAVRLYNDNFNPNELNVPINVKKSVAKITVSKITAVYKSGKLWKIKLTDTSNNKPLSKVSIKLKVYTGKKYKTYTVKTDSKGVATFKASTLAKGTHKVVLSISHKGYTCKAVTSSIKVNAKKLYIAGESNKFKNCAQLILGAYDKSSKKLISGIKLQIKIFTGKKYKTFNLVTKYTKALKAVGVLIETNAFSAGTHKVTVKVTTPNYSGYDTGKIVIPKSAKKYSKFTYVITKGKGKFL
ncbi:MAG: hypothetical protein Q4Q14_07240 [Methanobrevibacter sp.]|nr:hypothetical protein [Methanobrevibacter sp.]